MTAKIIALFKKCFFTALSNGKASALISFSRTLVLIVISLLVLPRIFGIIGAWIAVPAAEFLTLLLTGWMHRKELPWHQGDHGDR